MPWLRCKVVPGPSRCCAATATTPTTSDRRAGRICVIIHGSGSS
ncbi:hypothetical protein ACP4OV_027191 [Aristida adscensionis]